MEVDGAGLRLVHGLIIPRKQTSKNVADTAFNAYQACQAETS